MLSRELVSCAAVRLAGQPRELATDGDRVLPGDGDFLLGSDRRPTRAIDYTGCVSVELMNPRIWQIPARQFGEVAMTALRKVLGQAKVKRSIHHRGRRGSQRRTKAFFHHEQLSTSHGRGLMRKAVALVISDTEADIKGDRGRQTRFGGQVRGSDTCISSISSDLHISFAFVCPAAPCSVSPW